MKLNNLISKNIGFFFIVDFIHFQQCLALPYLDIVKLIKNKTSIQSMHNVALDIAYQEKSAMTQLKIYPRKKLTYMVLDHKFQPLTLFIRMKTCNEKQVIHILHTYSDQPTHPVWLLTCILRSYLKGFSSGSGGLYFRYNSQDRKINIIA